MKNTLRMMKASFGLLALLLVSTANAQQYTKITYVHTEADGTPFAATDSQGNIEWQIDHYPYGAEYSNTQVARKNDISFAGKPYDDEIGLSYFGARWYDPATGRFTGVDPVQVIPDDYRTFNRYSYAFNNPYKYQDPDGRLAFLIPVAIWAGKALMVTGAATSGYAAGSAGYDLYSGRKSTGEALTDGAIGVASGFVLKGGGGTLVKYGKKFAPENLTTRVGRWMSKIERESMQSSGRVQESYSGTTHVADPANRNAFQRQASSGSEYVEFNVPTSSLKRTNEGWSKVVGPNSLEGRAAAKAGRVVPQMPKATKIKVKAKKK